MTTNFTRWAIALAAGGDAMSAAAIYAKRWGTDRRVDMIAKAAVAAGTTTGSSWAKPIAEYENMASEFVEMLRPRTVLGRLAGLRRVPFNIKFSKATAGTSVGWAGEGKPIPVARMAFASETLGHAKIAGIVAVTKELALSSDPAAEALIEADLVAATAAFEDSAFLSSAAAGAASPAGMLNGVTPVTSTGTTQAAVAADLAELVASAATALVAPAFIMAPRTATWLAGLGFDKIGPLGGELLGVPVLTTTQAPSETGGSPAVTTGSIILVDAAEILFAESAAEVDASENATIQLDSAPSDPVSASTVATSLWQQNLVGLRVIRWVNWKKRRPGAVGVLVGVPG